MKKEKINIYEEVTNKIVAALEQGITPWKRPWKTSSEAMRNVVSDKAYRGINVMLLNIASAVGSYSDPRWLTYKQAAGMGGNVKKGEKGTHIVYWNFIKKEDANDPTAKPKLIPFLRYYTVFNVQQCENLNIPGLAPDVPDFTIGGVNELAEKILALATVRHGGDRACFSINSDIVVLPHRSLFETPDQYYAVAMHEMGHWTGHSSRLNRDFSGRFGSQAYAFEELVAEMSSAFTDSCIGVDFDNMQHPEYIASWITALKNDTKAIFTAASKAQAATDYLLEKAGIQMNAEEEELAEAA